MNTLHADYLQDGILNTFNLDCIKLLQEVCQVLISEHTAKDSQLNTLHGHCKSLNFDHITW